MVEVEVEVEVRRGRGRGDGWERWAEDWMNWTPDMANVDQEDEWLWRCTGTDGEVSGEGLDCERLERKDEQQSKARNVSKRRHERRVLDKSYDCCRAKHTTTFALMRIVLQHDKQRIMGFGDRHQMTDSVGKDMIRRYSL